MDEAHHQQLIAIQKAAFLEAFAPRANVSEAARVAGVGRRMYYHWRRDDEEFRHAAEDLAAACVDRARQEIYERGMGLKTQVVLDKDKNPVYRRDPYTGELVLSDDFELIPLEMPVNCPQSLFRYLEANAREYAKQPAGVHVGLSAPDGEEEGERRITVTYVLPDGKTEADYDHGGGDDPLD